MNFGIYVKNLSDENEMSFVSKLVNFAINNNQIADCSIFYDGVGFMPFDIPCGMFNSTDLWNFHGKLLILNIDCVKSALNIVNNIDIFYHYGWNDGINVFNLMQICNNVNIICKTEKDKNNLLRLTDKKDSFVCNDEGIIQFLLGRV
jgi:hypothetical protein